MRVPSRKKFVDWLRAYILREHFPRFEMAVVLGVTGLTGFLTTVTLRRLGVEEMWQRYPAAAVVAYIAFLVQVWVLVRVYRAGADRALATASEEFVGAEPVRLDLPDGPDPGGCIDLPGDEGCAIIAAIVVVLSLVIVAVYFVATAPTLLSEVLLDSLLVGGLYRRLRRNDEGEWFLSALRRTAIPAIVVIVILAVAGMAFSDYAPEAKSIGDVIGKWRGDR